MNRLSPQIEQDIIRTASERRTYGYRRIWAMLRNNSPQYIALQFRSSMKLLRISLEYIQKHTPEDNGNVESFPQLTQDGLRLAIRVQ